MKTVVVSKMALVDLAGSERGGASSSSILPSAFIL